MVAFLLYSCARTQCSNSIIQGVRLCYTEMPGEQMGFRFAGTSGLQYPLCVGLQRTLSYLGGDG